MLIEFTMPKWITVTPPTSDWFYRRFMGFGFNIPDEATITGWEIEIGLGGDVMQAPPAGMIEAAKDQLKAMQDAKQPILEHQARELHAALGDPLSADLLEGYLLGLQTARVTIAGSVQVQMQKIDPDAIL